MTQCWLNVWNTFQWNMNKSTYIFTKTKYPFCLRINVLIQLHQSNMNYVYTVSYTVMLVGNSIIVRDENWMCAVFALNPYNKVRGTHLRQTRPRWAPYWPHELCYLGTLCLDDLKSFPPSVAYVHQWTRPALIMTLWLFGAKPLPEPLLIYCEFDP